MPSRLEYQPFHPVSFAAFLYSLLLQRLPNLPPSSPSVVNVWKLSVSPFLAVFLPSHLSFCSFIFSIPSSPPSSSFSKSLGWLPISSSSLSFRSSSSLPYPSPYLSLLSIIDHEAHLNLVFSGHKHESTINCVIFLSLFPFPLPSLSKSSPTTTEPIMLILSFSPQHFKISALKSSPNSVLSVINSQPFPF